MQNDPGTERLGQDQGLLRLQAVDRHQQLGVAAEPLHVEAGKEIRRRCRVAAEERHRMSVEDAAGAREELEEGLFVVGVLGLVGQGDDRLRVSRCDTLGQQVGGAR